MSLDPTQIEREVMAALDTALGMKLDLKEDPDYDLRYITEKLAKVSSFQERLSDIQIRMTQFSLVVTTKSSNTTALLKTKEAILKASPEYGQKKVPLRSSWIRERTEGLRQEASTWQDLRRMVSEVKDAIGERASTFRRLDSDLRLHTKLYEARVASGATGGPGFGGSEGREFDLG